MEYQNSVTSVSNEEPSFSDCDLTYTSVVYEDGDDYNHPTGILPGTDDHAGCLNFQLFLNNEDKSKKSWLYSSVLKKLYIDINKVVCVQFRLKQPESGKINSSKESLFVRALPVYAAPEFLQEPVTRCPVHVMTDKANGHSNVPWLFHVLRAEHHEAVYHINRKSNRHSVVVPLHTPALGSEFITIMYKFTCKTSCAFGLNRRPVHVVFTLENAQGQILGRRKLLVKVCSCPKRDLHRDEIVSKTEIDANGRKRKVKEVDNSMAYSSMEIYSPATKEIKMEHLDVEETVEDDNMPYTIPSFTVMGKQQYISTLELLHGHFLGLSVRNDALIDLHPNISHISELLDKIKNESS
ncbi:cellular tumor antigen p53-like [Planococcus citri]|uniref:cellular tumor antigen p53-like n=1 Tax=Planococcus citri TaxID=170843 RepID=UPI0031F92080